MSSLFMILHFVTSTFDLFLPKGDTPYLDSVL